MSYASLLELPDSYRAPLWWWTQSEAEHDFPQGVLDNRVWGYGDRPTFAPAGASGFATYYASGAVTVEPGDPIFSDETSVASACRDACTCCCQLRPALRARIWPIARVLEHLT